MKSGIEGNSRPVGDAPDFARLIGCLETFWAEPDGVLYRLRQGDYDRRGVQEIVDTLAGVDVTDSSRLPRRFVALTWWLPEFMAWQVPRVKEHDGDIAALRADIDRVRTALERVLGVP